MSLEQIISEKLTESFKPLKLKVENESHHHSGHSGMTDQAKVTGVLTSLPIYLPANRGSSVSA